MECGRHAINSCSWMGFAFGLSMGFIQALWFRPKCLKHETAQILMDKPNMAHFKVVYYIQKKNLTRLGFGEKVDLLTACCSYFQWQIMHKE